MSSIGLVDKGNFVRVNFTNRGFAKLAGKPESLSNETPNKTTIVNVAKLFSDVKIDRGQPTTFKSIPEFLGIDYVGYIIEKERLDRKTGEWIRIDEFRLIGAATKSFTDTRVAYGQSYRYRMKSIIKLTKSVKKAGLSHLEAQRNIEAFEKEQIEKQLIRNNILIQNLDKVTNLGLSSKVSSGQQSEEIDLSSGVTMRADSSFTDVVKQSTLQKENLRLLENSRIADPKLASGVLGRSGLQTLINDNLEKFKEFFTTYESVYFESNPSKNWIYVDVVENEPPPPPQTIKIVPDSNKKQIVISWLKPANAQRDIKFFKIYRRRGVGFGWTLLAEAREIDLNQDGFVDASERILAESALIPVNTNLFIDKSVEFGNSYIYALSCVDVHGIESFLSVQVQAELNEKYSLEKQEKPLKWISGSGARPNEVNFVLKKFVNRTEQLIAKNGIFIAPTTKFAETSKNLIIKVKSLDTHTVHEIKVTLINANETKTES